MARHFTNPAGFSPRQFEAYETNALVISAIESDGKAFFGNTGMQTRLREAGYDATDIFTQGPVRLLFVSDPDGNLVEVACWTQVPVGLATPAT